MFLIGATGERDRVFRLSLAVTWQVNSWIDTRRCSVLSLRATLTEGLLLRDPHGGIDLSASIAACDPLGEPGCPC